jgi:NADH-quinone oxidoreductase subunit M
MLYERYHTRQMADYGGMAARLRALAAFMVFVTLSSIGLPGLNGFVGEVLVMAGMFNFDAPTAGESLYQHRLDHPELPLNGPLLVVLGVPGVLLGAWYMLTLLRRVFFGPLKEPHHDGHGAAPDLNGREWAALVPIAAACVWLGTYPGPFIDTARPELRAVAAIAEEAKARLRNQLARDSEPAAPDEPRPRTVKTDDDPDPK